MHTSFQATVTLLPGVEPGTTHLLIFDVSAAPSSQFLDLPAGTLTQA
jgi:hypothetical protein